MVIQVALNHRAQYRYDKAVSLGLQVIQLRPAPHCRTPILSYSLNVIPAEHLLNWQMDLHYNYLGRVLFPGKTNEFVVDVDLVADLSTLNPFDFFLEPGVANYLFEYAPGVAKDLEPYRSVDQAGSRLRTFLASISDEKRGTIDFLVKLNHRVGDEVSYVTRLDVRKIARPISGDGKGGQLHAPGHDSVRANRWLQRIRLRQSKHRC